MMIKSQSISNQYEIILKNHSLCQFIYRLANQSFEGNRKLLIRAPNFRLGKQVNTHDGASELTHRQGGRAKKKKIIFFYSCL